ncbi:MAG: glycine--tRNA ligase subunit beta [Gammaproteobacteria bacterium]|nr:glycine--tRNA ligase subunit beta [Gammaproteobacteria bacterium]
MNKQDLLIEIGTEELPPKALKKLSQAFLTGVKAGLDNAELAYSSIKPFASPRRLAIVVTDLDDAQPDKNVERRGPALQAAYDDEGCPTKAADGFARSCGVTVEQLEKVETDKGTWLVFRNDQKGQATVDLIPAIVNDALDKLPIPRRMRWGDLDAQFVRPVHWVVMLFGNTVIDTEILSVKTGRETYGHRYHAPQAITIPAPAEYEVLLESTGKVIADFERRKQTVRAQVEQAAIKLKGKAVIDEDLLDEVTSMVEWPVAVSGNFEERFLDVPSEALILTMATNQKYFHLFDNKGKLLPHFITISNIESKNPLMVSEGNERVIRPRFSDAEFFWNQDRKTRLDKRLESLKHVIFQKKLGSIYDKTKRVMQVASYIAKQLGANELQAIRAAELCKCDLMTQMVGEFPSLQGIMGRYYAQHDGEEYEVAIAQDDYYKPRFAGDALPDNVISQAVAIADRVDTLLGIIASGQIPTGDKDPYALRRAALGVLRILIEKNIALDLQQLLLESASTFDESIGANVASVPVMAFMLDRLHAYYHDRGIRADILDAVTSVNITSPCDINSRIQAVSTFSEMSEAESLAAANKRISNILKKVEAKLPTDIDSSIFVEPEEHALNDRLTQLNDSVTALVNQGEYEQALSQLAGLRETIDNFFDKVMVMAEETKLRDNRIALLNQLHNLFMQVADISKLQA